MVAEGAQEAGLQLLRIAESIWTHTTGFQAASARAQPGLWRGYKQVMLCFNRAT